MADGRVMIVSNRLPYCARATAEGVTLTPAAGGLATGLRGFHERGDSIWVGWSGDASSLSRRHRPEVASLLLGRGIVPVHLSRNEVSAYYDGFCNGVLWPLLHYLVDDLPSGVAPWEAYCHVNRRFADAVVREYRSGDLIWIHDYHLMLVPGMVRAHLPDAAIGFFLHVPFPAEEVFRALPWRREILVGMLGATRIGFHTDDYASHFLDAVRALTVFETGRGLAIANERPVDVGVYPMGVDAARFAALADDPEVRRQRDALLARPVSLLLGIDRLDYTKGIARRLLAFEQLLERRVDLRGRVQLVQVAVPSRTEVPAYRQLRREVDEIVGRINGRFATLDWTPVGYFHRSLTSEQLVALYCAADVMLVTPVRDGMNLVAKEFVASRTDEDGVLVLSEFAGAARELPEALAVNPYAVEEMADTIASALAMPAAQRRRRMVALRRRVVAHDLDWWAGSFLADLRETPVGNASDEVSRRESRQRSAGLPWGDDAMPVAASA
jgi:trehalose 6-phosphate synthase/phosphatase